MSGEGGAEMSEQPLRRCTTCRLELPAAQFRFSSARTVKSGERHVYLRRVCVRCEARAREREKAGKPNRRMPKRNSRGEVWCPACRQYRHSDHFRPHPLRAGSFWSYCTDCDRKLGREAYRFEMARPGAREKQRARDRESQRRRRAQRMGERRQMVWLAMQTLQRRGLTKAEISRVTGINENTLHKWERAAVLPKVGGAERIRVLLLLTADWPVGERKWKKQVHGPGFAALLEAWPAAVADLPPMRSKWKRSAE